VKHTAVLCLVSFAVGVIAPSTLHTVVANVALWAAYWVAVEWQEPRS